MLTSLQRFTSTLPMARPLKRCLHNNVTACGLMYRLSTLRSQPGFTVIMYHRVLERSDPWHDKLGAQLSVFEAQLRMLRRWCAVLSLDEIFNRLDHSKPLPRHCVALTFDDGFRDFYTLAWPLLKRYRLPTTLYVATGAVERGWMDLDVLRCAIQQTAERSLTVSSLSDGPVVYSLVNEEERIRTFWALVTRTMWMTNQEVVRRLIEEVSRQLLHVAPSAITPERMMLNWDELQRVASDGVDVGAHTVTHPNLAALPDDEAQREIVNSRATLQSRLDHPIGHFAYPVGQPIHFSERVQALVRQAGFRSACTTVAGTNRLMEDRFTLKRINGACASLRALVRAMVEAAS